MNAVECDKKQTDISLSEDHVRQFDLRSSTSHFYFNSWQQVWLSRVFNMNLFIYLLLNVCVFF